MQKTWLEENFEVNKAKDANLIKSHTMYQFYKQNFKSNRFLEQEKFSKFVKKTFQKGGVSLVSTSVKWRKYSLQDFKLTTVYIFWQLCQGFLLYTTSYQSQVYTSVNICMKSYYCKSYKHFRPAFLRLASEINKDKSLTGRHKNQVPIDISY